MASQISNKAKTLSAAGAIIALGIIYGDIGTSPLYVMKAFLHSASNITSDLTLGILSCIIWTLTLQTTIKYVFITLKADNRGEGGIFALFALLRRKRRWLFIFAIVGGSAMLSDGIIAPSITVLSAVEGLTLINRNIPVVYIVLLIITLLFFFQHFGTSRVGKTFGPIMFIWFSTIGILGLSQIIQNHEVLRAFDPRHAISLLTHHPKGFLLLGIVFLCTTGAEVLYTDLGHCGIQNIRVSWLFVKTTLVLSYLGQGAWIISNLSTLTSYSNPFFAIMPVWFLPYGIVLATIAALIACQAMISGTYTLISEATSLSFWPKIRIKYPSSVKEQMYIPSVTWVLYICCMLVIIMFRSSTALSTAYGLAITLTMLMTTILVSFYLVLRKQSLWVVFLFGISYLAIESLFLISNINKFTHGGWITLLLTSILTTIMLSLYLGRRIRNRFITFDKIEKYLPFMEDLIEDKTIPKYSSHLVYTTHANNRTEIEAKAIQSIMNLQPKRADVYWFLHVNIVDEPYTLEYKVTHLIPKKVIRVDFYMGFKMQPRINDYFKQVVNQLDQEGVIDLISPYPSLRKHKIQADFRIVQIERRASRTIDLPYFDKIIINLYYFFKRFGISDVNAWGLDTSIVTVERIPLTIPCKSSIPDINPR